MENQSPESEKDYSIVIRGVSIVINAIGMLFYLVFSFGPMLTYEFSDLPLGRWWIAFTMWGLAPLIVTTYFLWYLKRPNENLCGIFIATPAAIFIHYVTIGVAAHAEFLGKYTRIILIAIELLAAIGFVVVARRKGYVRR